MSEQKIKTSQKGIDYIGGILKDKTSVITRCQLQKIPRKNHPHNITLKLGRYKKNRLNFDIPKKETIEEVAPKSELTLDDKEFKNLIKFLQSNLNALKEGVRKFISIDNMSDDDIQYLKAVLTDGEKQKAIRLINENNLLSDDILKGVEYFNRIAAVEKFEKMLGESLKEQIWQKWFEENDWVLGSDFVRILDERNIDTNNRADFLIESFDGFLDIIEIKKPDENNLSFWARNKDHNNYYPSTALTKSIIQSTTYLQEIEGEANSNKFLKKTGSVKTIKPRCTLIFGRSNDWNEEQKESFRILNASYHNLLILTYDHVLERAKRIMKKTTNN